MENKKILGTKRTFYLGIYFRSKIEARHYELLKEANLNPEYEVETFDLLEGFYPKNMIFIREFKPRNKSRVFDEYPYKIYGMTYTPDFRIIIKKEGKIKYKIYIDSKGHPNDTYPLKKKLFMSLLEKKSIEEGIQYIFIEPHSIKHIKKTIEIIKAL